MSLHRAVQPYLTTPTLTDFNTHGSAITKSTQLALFNDSLTGNYTNNELCARYNVCKYTLIRYRSPNYKIKRQKPTK